MRIWTGKNEENWLYKIAYIGVSGVLKIPAYQRGIERQQESLGSQMNESITTGMQSC